jgi:VanZ family protein
LRAPSAFWRWAAGGWAVVIFISGLLPTADAVKAVWAWHDTVTTTVGHFVAYALLGFLLGVALGGWRVDLRRLALGLVLAAVLGGAIELIQGPLPYRDMQLADFLVDVAGAAAGLVVFSAAVRAKRSRSRRG